MYRAVLYIDESKMRGACLSGYRRLWENRNTRRIEKRNSRDISKNVWKREGTKHQGNTMPPKENDPGEST